MKKSAALFVAFIATLIQNPISAQPGESTTITTTTTTTTVAYVTPDETQGVDYMPKIHGVVRTRWEGEFIHGDFGQRFQVRNARVSVGGNILKSLSYFVQIDACDRGKFTFLDAYARWGFSKNWRVQAGQFRVPYGVDCFRAPGGYYFANRSFLGKHMLNMREIGAKIGYYGSKIPLTVEAGIFNSAPKSNHEVWQKTMNYAAKATYRISNITIATGFISAEPDKVRMNLVDGALTWDNDRWIVEGEYQYKHYDADKHKPAHGWNLFASYAIPLEKTVFNTLSIQGRFDGMTAHSSGQCNSNGSLSTDQFGRQRITVGSTLAYNHKSVKAAIRLNYEKYFHDKQTPQGEADKIVAELVVRF